MRTTNPNRVSTTTQPGWYKRLFARMIAAEQESRRQLYDARKRTLLGDLHGDVLEIGPGAGANLAYYAPDIHWHGLENNAAMFPYLEKEAERLSMQVRLLHGSAEAIDLPDESCDAVVGTLVLCSVSDPRRTLSEIHRVLKVGGRFVFIEHVAAPRESGLRRWQQIAKPLWKPLSDGCHPDRETWVMIENAGFGHVEVDHFHLKMPIVGPHIAGFALK